MKKFITTALALVLTLGMSVTAFAAASPSAGVTEVTGTLADGTPVQADVTDLDAKTIAAAQEEAKTRVGADSQVVAAWEVTLPEDVSKENPVTFGFPLTGVEEGTAVVALHLTKDGVWETLDCTWKDGQVWVTFTSLSPVVFVSAKAATPAAAGSSDGAYDKYVTQSTGAAASDGVTSPKTADEGAGILVFAVLLCGTALICVNRKRA